MTVTTVLHEIAGGKRSSKKKKRENATSGADTRNSKAAKWQHETQLSIVFISCLLVFYESYHYGQDRQFQLHCRYLISVTAEVTSEIPSSPSIIYESSRAH